MKIMILELKIESILEHQADEQKETGDLCRGSVQKGGPWPAGSHPMLLWKNRWRLESNTQLTMRRSNLGTYYKLI